MVPIIPVSHFQSPHCHQLSGYNLCFYRLKFGLENWNPPKFVQNASVLAPIKLSSIRWAGSSRATDFGLCVIFLFSSPLRCKIVGGGRRVMSRYCYWPISFIFDLPDIPGVLINPYAVEQLRLRRLLHRVNEAESVEPAQNERWRINEYDDAAVGRISCRWSALCVSLWSTYNAAYWRQDRKITAEQFSCQLLCSCNFSQKSYQCNSKCCCEWKMRLSKSHDDIWLKSAARKSLLAQSEHSFPSTNYTSNTNKCWLRK